MFLLRIFFWVVILLFCVIIKRFMNDLYYTITPPPLPHYSIGLWNHWVIKQKVCITFVVMFVQT